MYSTLALEKEREIVKKETALRKEKEAACCYAVQGCIRSYTCIYTGSRDGLENHMYMYMYYTNKIYRVPKQKFSERFQKLAASSEI